MALLMVTGLAACSSEKAAEPAPSRSTAEAPKALTREQGAEKYTEIVSPYNRALGKCMAKYNPVWDSQLVSSADLPEIRSACREMPEANREFVARLEETPWPPEVRKAVGQLVDELQADQLAWDGLADVQGPMDVFQPKYPLHEDGPAADLVRAHLGLPGIAALDQ
ncbi:hypothetical protein AB0M23_01585 [Streptomyces sp. NPDC052077]|uniref:hypothetical protein n=1 Tax=Streptomyces sp. NPDC052077 TaxID=3154757 RepID=UPI00341D58D7